MKINNRIKFLTFILISIFLFNTKNVYAASASISATKTTANVGDNVTISVNCYGASWNLHLTGSINDTLVGYDSDGTNTSCSKSFSLNTSTPGSYTVNLTGDITDQNETNSNVNSSITITVRENTTQNNKSETTNTNTKNNSTQKKEEKVENKEITKEEKEEIQEKKTNINITKFKIVGYDVKFDVNKTTYSIDILENLEEVYVIIEGEDIKVSQSGLINIKDKDKIEITISNNDMEKTYIIKLNRISEQSKINSPKQNKIPIILGAVLLLVITLILIVLIIKKKKKKEKYYEK